MSLGVYNTYIGEVFQSDVFNIPAFLTINGQPVTADQITGVTYTVQTPSIQQQINTSEPYVLPVDEMTFYSLEGIPQAGSVYIQSTAGVEEFSYTGVSDDTITGVTGGTEGAVINSGLTGTFVTSTTADGTVLPNGAANLLWSETTALGPYIATCQFSLVTGEKRSVITSFNVIDPFNPPQPTSIDMITEAVWLRLSDIFDSTEGGPALRDFTRNNFDQNKIAQFIPEALFDINTQMPPTNFTIDYFANPVAGPGGSPNVNMPLLIKGTLCLAIRHLMRSYTEIPTPTGQGQLVWQDRTRYQQAWGQIYQIEYDDYIAAVRLFKRQTLRLGHATLLTLNKQGRLYPYGNSAYGIYRGYN